MRRRGGGERDAGHQHHRQADDALVLLSRISVRVEDVEGVRDESYLEGEQPGVQLGLGVGQVALKHAKVLEELDGQGLSVGDCVLQLCTPLHQVA